MKQNTKNNFMKLLSSFLTSVVLSSACVVAVKYYITFAEQTAGSYSIAMLMGDSLRDFLIKALLLVAGILAFVTFAVKVKKCKAPKKDISVLYDWNGCIVDCSSIFVSLYNQQIYRRFNSADRIRYRNYCQCCFYDD